MKIMITGAAGYLGGEILNQIANRTQHQLISVDNDAESLRTRAGFTMQHNNVTWYNADITDARQVAALPRPDMIVHLAAIVGYVLCGQTPELSRKTNITGTQIISDLDVPTIFLSTGSIYGEIGMNCIESTTPNPMTLYAETKLIGEGIVRHGSHVILRPATAYGLSLKVRHDLLVHTLSLDAVVKKKIELYQPNAMRSFYSIQKIAELIGYIIENYSKFENETINVGCHSGNVNKRQVVELIAEQCTFDLDLIQGKDLDTRDYHVDYTKLEQLWPGIDENFQEHVAKIVRYYQLWNK